MIPLSNKHASKRTKETFDACVAAIGCEPAALEAVIAVESAKRGYDRHGRLTALFEPHKFYALLEKHAPSKLSAAVSQGLAYPRWGERPYPKDSYPRIIAASKIDEELALQATSWGLPQILGSNYRNAGYKSAADMVTAFLVGEDEQLSAMTKLVVAWKLDGALRSKNWKAFARAYNGSGYAKNAYDTRLQKAYTSSKLAKTLQTAATGTAVIVGGGGATVATANETAGADPTIAIVVLIIAVVAAALMFIGSKLAASKAIEHVSAPKADADDPANIEERLAMILDMLKGLHEQVSAQTTKIEVLKAQKADLQAQLASAAAAQGTLTAEEQAEADAIQAELGANSAAMDAVVGG